MKKVFEQFKLKEIESRGYKGIVAGYSGSHFIVATLEEPPFAFEDDDEQFYIHRDYRTKKYKYFYIDESTLNKIFEAKPELGKSYTPTKTL